MPGVSASGILAPKRLGEYKLLEKLGQGGMGVVYKALHTELERIVALKVLSVGRVDDDRAVARFKREMKAVGRLDHPHIVRAHDAREIDGTPVLVMEYVDGLDLGELVHRLGRLPATEACELVRQAALGLQCAHEHGLVHRDVKPSNLVLSSRAEVKVLDLGLARIHASRTPGKEMTSVGEAMGTPEYMAPEQVSDSHSVDIRADVYSLGCTLYTLLAGRPPFSGPDYTSAYDTMTAHVHHPPPPIGEFRDDLPDELVAILDRMLAKKPDQRFLVPQEVADALAPLANGADLPALLAGVKGSTGPTPASPLSGRRPQSPPRAQRRRYLGAVAITLALAVVAVAVWIVAGIRRDARLPITPSPRTAAPTVAHAQKPLPGRIVLSWSPPGAGKADLWLFQPDGAERVQLTDAPQAFDVHPTFSPDGRRIAFIRGDRSTQSSGVWILNADGSDPRPVVRGKARSERLASPVWISNSRIAYTRDPKLNRSPDMEVWQVDVDVDAEPQRMFRFDDALSEGGGLVCDVSPDGRGFVVVAQRPGLWPTADLYVTDLEGNLLRTLWADHPDDRKDTRAFWSADGRKIAWHHNFTGGAQARPIYYGVGLSRLGPDGSWTAQLQPDHDTFITPLAWSPDGPDLLCLRLEDGRPEATLFLMDDRFQPTRELFRIEADCWQPAERDFGRLGDWAVLPDDVAPPQAD